jgi:FkbM family methyltransferase
MPFFDPKRIAPDGTWRANAIHRVSSHIPRDMTLPILQGPLRGGKWIVGAASHACWLGTYESRETSLLGQGIKRGDVVFDLGAQAGYHSLYAARLTGETGKVWAFEPNPVNVHFLKKHMELNRVTNVEVMECAVSDFDGDSWFDEGKNCFSGHLSDSGTRRVRTICLDKEVHEGRLPMPDYLKIDVEGAEFKVLSGAAAILREKHPTVLLETHEWLPGFESARDDCWRFLSTFDYHLETTTDFHIYARARSQTAKPV